MRAHFFSSFLWISLTVASLNEQSTFKTSLSRGLSTAFNPAAFKPFFSKRRPFTFTME
ncbi:TPA: hypothetical protein HA244_01420 [Candidatus Micrarchaeota archaeon]|nr:hypothetical protein [Candidatus Micrarchaeota archaeon]